MPRKVEVFTAGCPLCKDTVQLVKKVACSSCEVTIYDLNENGMQRAHEYGVNSVPCVVVDGKVIESCKIGKITERDLRAAGIGEPL